MHLKYIYIYSRETGGFQWLLPHILPKPGTPRSHSPGPAPATALSPGRAPGHAALGGALHPATAAQEAAPNGEWGPGEGGDGGMVVIHDLLMVYEWWSWMVVFNDFLMGSLVLMTY